MFLVMLQVVQGSWKVARCCQGLTYTYKYPPYLIGVGVHLYQECVGVPHPAAASGQLAAARGVCLRTEIYGSTPLA